MQVREIGSATPRGCTRASPRASSRCRPLQEPHRAHRRRASRERAQHHGRDDARGRDGGDRARRDRGTGRGRTRSRPVSAVLVAPRRRATLTPARRGRAAVITFALHGIGVSGGIAIGRAQLVSHATLEVAHYTIPAIARRPARSRASTSRSTRCRRSSTALHGAMTRDGELPGEFGAFLDVHWMILNDPTLAEAPKRIIAEQRCNAEWALTQQMNVLVDQFDQIEDPYLRERKADVVQVVERVLKRLMGKPGSLPTAVAEEQHDPGRARPLARRRHPVQAAPLRRVPDRPRRRDVAHGDRRAQPQRAGGRRHAQRAAADPRRRDADRRRHATTSSSSIPTARCSPSTG